MKTTGIPKAPIARVEWMDSCTGGRWASMDDYLRDSQPLKCVSVGYLICRDKRRVVLVQSAAENGHVADSMVIPIACVKRVTILAR